MVPYLHELQDFLRNYALIISTTGALIAFSIKQFYDFSSSRVERTIRSANEIKDFDDDPHVKAFFKIMDWKSGSVLIKQINGDFVKVDFDYDLISNALRDHRIRRKATADDPRKGIGNFSEREELIRSCADGFFTRLDRTYVLIRGKAVHKSDFYEYFYYWLELIHPTNNRSNTMSIEKRELILNFARVYGYRNFDLLIKILKEQGRK